MRLNQVTAFLLVCSLVASQPVFAQQVRDLGELEKVILAELEETGTPGAAVIIVSGDRPLLVKAYGVANIETGVPLTTDTLLRVSNLSKFFTAAVLVSLADEGKLDLDAPIGRYVKGLSRKLSRVTTRQLLSETAGIKEEHLLLSIYDGMALGNIVRTWKNDWLIAEPERFHSASHPGYAVAGLVLETVAGKPFADVMAEKLFAPLGMNRSTCHPLVMVTHPFSQGHRMVDGQKATVFRPFASNSFGWPSEAVFSTANDLSRFLLAFLNGGKIDGGQGIAPSVIATLAKPHTPGWAFVKGEASYGLRSTKHGSEDVLSGNFSWGGMALSARIATVPRFAVVIFSNGRGLTKSNEKAMQMFLGPTAPRVNDPQSMSQAEMSRYTGKYANERVLTLFIRDGKLFVRDDSAGVLGSFSRGREGEVTRVEENRFWIASWSASFSFVRGRNRNLEFLHYGARALKRR